MPESSFDAIAKNYDRDFTYSSIGRMQRQRVHHFLTQTLKGKKLNILEVNCGTGEDAIWLSAMGHAVIATDISTEMIAVAKVKAPQIDFRVCAFNELRQKFDGQKFDLIFSNFGGLNCLDRNMLAELQTSFSDLLHENGQLVVVFISKKSWMERLYFQFKRMPEKANRRMHADQAQLSPGISQNTYCYATNELMEIFHSFRLQHSYPIGIVIPPSYLEKAFHKLILFTPLTMALEIFLSRFSFLGDYGDHIYVDFRK